MAVNRSSHLVMRPDGTMVRAPAGEGVDDDPAETETLGDQFEALLDIEAGEGRGEAAKPPPSSLPTPARLAAEARHGEAGADGGRGRDHAKAARPGERAGDHRADPALQIGAEAAVRAKQHKHDREGGEQHAGGGAGDDASGAMMAFQSDPAAPPPAAGAQVAKAAPAATGGPAMAEIANQVAARIATSGGQGAAKVRIDVREDLLPQTSLTVEDQAGTVVVTVASGSNHAAAALASGAEELGRAISRRTGRRTRIDFGGRSWTTDADEAVTDPTAAPDESR